MKNYIFILYLLILAGCNLHQKNQQEEQSDYPKTTDHQKIMFDDGKAKIIAINKQNYLNAENHWLYQEHLAEYSTLPDEPAQLMYLDALSFEIFASTCPPLMQDCLILFWIDGEAPKDLNLTAKDITKLHKIKYIKNMGVVSKAYLKSIGKDISIFSENGKDGIFVKCGVNNDKSCYVGNKRAIYLDEERYNSKIYSKQLSHRLNPENNKDLNYEKWMQKIDDTFFDQEFLRNLLIEFGYQPNF